MLLWVHAAKISSEIFCVQLAIEGQLIHDDLIRRVAVDAPSHDSRETLEKTQRAVPAPAGRHDGETVPIERRRLDTELDIQEQKRPAHISFVISSHGIALGAHVSHEILSHGADERVEQPRRVRRRIKFEDRDEQTSKLRRDHVLVGGGHRVVPLVIVSQKTERQTRVTERRTDLAAYGAHVLEALRAASLLVQKERSQVKDFARARVVQMLGKGSWLRTHPTFVGGREGVGQGGRPDETNLSARMRVSTEHTPRDPKSSKCSHVFAFGEAVTRSRAEL
jgi:hypothetical protein